jgi:hypothetical protein
MNDAQAYKSYGRYVGLLQEKLNQTEEQGGKSDRNHKRTELRTHKADLSNISFSGCKGRPGCETFQVLKPGSRQRHIRVTPYFPKRLLDVLGLSNFILRP